MITVYIELKNGFDTLINIDEEDIKIERAAEIEKLQNKLMEMQNMSNKGFAEKVIGKKVAAKLNQKISNKGDNFELQDEYDYSEVKTLRGESFSNWIENVKGFKHSLVGSANNLRSSAEKTIAIILEMNPEATVDFQREKVEQTFGKMNPLKEAVLEWIFGTVDE